MAMTKRITTKEAARYLGISKSRLEKLRGAGGGPIFIRLGRAVRYDTGELDRYLASARVALPGLGACASASSLSSSSTE